MVGHGVLESGVAWGSPGRGLGTGSGGTDVNGRGSAGGVPPPHAQGALCEEGCSVPLGEECPAPPGWLCPCPRGANPAEIWDKIRTNSPHLVPVAKARAEPGAEQAWAGCAPAVVATPQQCSARRAQLGAAGDRARFPEDTPQPVSGSPLAPARRFPAGPAGAIDPSWEVSIPGARDIPVLPTLPHVGTLLHGILLYPLCQPSPEKPLAELLGLTRDRAPAAMHVPPSCWPAPALCCVVLAGGPSAWRGCACGTCRLPASWDPQFTRGVAGGIAEAAGCPTAGDTRHQPV